MPLSSPNCSTPAPFLRIGLAAISHTEQIMDCAAKLVEYFHTHGRAVLLEAPLMAAMAQCGYTAIRHCQARPLDELCDTELVVALGGDGNMLRVARALIFKCEVALVGVNFGHIGFLTDLQAETVIAGFDKIFAGEYFCTFRPILQATLLDNQGNVLAVQHAVNEVTLRGFPKIVDMEIAISERPPTDLATDTASVTTAYSGLYRNEFVYQDRADGVIIATATGSSAHALAAGGPIIHPDLPATLIVPICSYILTNRPITIPSSLVITIRIHGRTKSANWTYDGNCYSEPLTQSHKLQIVTISQGLRFLHPKHYNFFENCHAKIGIFQQGHPQQQ